MTLQNMTPPLSVAGDCLVERAGHCLSLEPDEKSLNVALESLSLSEQKLADQWKRPEPKDDLKKRLPQVPSPKHSSQAQQFKEATRSGSKPRVAEGRQRVQPLPPADFFRVKSMVSRAKAGKMSTGQEAEQDTKHILLSKNSSVVSATPADKLCSHLQHLHVSEDDSDKDKSHDGELSERGPERVKEERKMSDRAAVGPYQARRAYYPSGPVPVNCRAAVQLSTQQHFQAQRQKALAYSEYEYDDSHQVVPAAGDLFNRGYSHPNYIINRSANVSLGSPSESGYSPGYHSPSYSPGQEEIAPVATVHPHLSPCAKQAPNLPTTPFADGLINQDDLARILPPTAELPDELSDFILKYSRRYSTDTPPTSVSPASDDSGVGSRKNSASDGSTGSDSPRHIFPIGRPRSASDDATSGCDSPLSAGSAPQSSPAAPRGAMTPSTPTALMQLIGNQNNTKRYKPILPKANLSNRTGKARDKLLNLFSDEEKDLAWYWAVRCIQSCPGALWYRDPDGDSLLHIVVWKRDLPKIYALVEQMMKTDYTPCEKPFDMPNRLHETPLFLAVEKRCEEVVGYLLECGANPNFRTIRTDADAPLHYAAARGMAEIVEALCSSPLTDQNLRNGLGVTPLICAVKNHGVIEEESQCLVNNKPTIRALLKAGADPKIPDATNGKTVLHYAVERMDPDLVEIFSAHLEDDHMTQLVNLTDYNGETVLQLLGRMSAGPRTGLARGEAEEEMRKKMFVTLVNCGASTAPELCIDTSSENGDSPYSTTIE